MEKHHIQQAKRTGIPELWQRLGLRAPAPRPGQTVRSPFRDEVHGSFWISRDGLRFKDMGDAEYSGDPIDFVITATGWSFRESVGWILGDEEKIKLRYYDTPTVKDPSKNFDPSILEQLEPAASSRDIRLWLVNRGIDLSYAHTECLKTHNNRLCFVFEKGVKCRPDLKNSHSAFWLTGGGHRCLFLEQMLDPSCPYTIITEGETDALVLRTMINEWGMLHFFNVLGAPGASWSPTLFWQGRLSGTEIIPVGDGDAAGEEFDRRVYLGFGKEPKRGPFEIPDGQDLGDILLKDPAPIHKKLWDLIEKPVAKLSISR